MVRRFFLPALWATIAASSGVLAVAISFGYDGSRVFAAVVPRAQDYQVVSVAMDPSDSYAAPERAVSQGQTDGTAAAGPSASVMGYAPIPEPATLGFLAMSAMVLVGSRVYRRE